MRKGKPHADVCRYGRLAIAILCWAAASGDAHPADRSQGAMTATVERRLVGVWRHSHEDDTDTQMVYRPGDFDFPPARGRRGYEFRSDHSCTATGISPRDGAAKTSCTWQLRDGARSEIVLTFPDGRRETLPLVSVDAERLIVRKLRE